MIWRLLTLLFLPLGSVFAAQKAVVIVPVADLRSDQSLPESGKSDGKQQTQLLLGETVEVVISSGAWVYVNATEQPEFTTHQKWEGYPGWVLRAALDMNGQRIKPSSAPPRDYRKEILKTAKGFIGTPYAWGGLSKPTDAAQARLTGLDCSGLIHISYRLNTVTVPRDSMDQYLWAQKINRRDLKPADLIFSAKAENPKKITHVTLFAGGQHLIEAPQTGMTVRKVSFKEKYGTDLSKVESGQIVGDRVIYFGRFLK